MTMTEVPGRVGPALVGRDRSLDVLRGLAIVCMMVDHLALWLDVTELRLTVGRVAMPLFFVLGGHLVTRIGPRLLVVVGVGVGLQLLAPWTGAGPLLATFASGAVVVHLLGRWPAALAALVAYGLMLGANGFASAAGGMYEPACLVALMGLGRLLPRSVFAGAAGGPRWLAAIGRRPLIWYAGHVLVLTALVPMM